jgi:hypothetical protein
MLFVLAFLADAINVDELFGLNSFQRDDASDSDGIPGIVTSSSTENPLKPLSFSTLAPKSEKARLELVDVDSPSLEAVYVSRDEMTPFLQETDSFVLPQSAAHQFNFYSLCKIQI